MRRRKLKNSTSSRNDLEEKSNNNNNLNEMSILTTPKRKGIFKQHFEDNNNEYKNDDEKNCHEKSVENSQISQDFYIPETPKSTKKRHYVSDDACNSGTQENHCKKPKISLDNFYIPTTSFYSKQALELSERYFKKKESTTFTSPQKETKNEISSKITNLLWRKNFNKMKFSKNKKIHLYSKKSKRPLPPKLGNNCGHKIRTRKKKKLSKIVVSKKSMKSEKQNKGNKESNNKILNSSNTVKEKIRENSSAESEDSDDDDGDDDDDDLLNLSYEVEIVNENQQNQFGEEQEQEKDNKTNRRFFKTNRKSIRNEIKILDNVKMTMFNGKLRVLPSEKDIRRNKLNKIQKKKKTKRRDKKFSKEHATVSEIIRQLSCSPELSENNLQEQKGLESVSAITAINEDHSLKTQNVGELTSTAAENYNEPCPIIYDDNVMFENYKEFLCRIPFNTNDPELIKRQHLLLEFLITHDICNEETFKIFIEDPENNKDKAENIINNLTTLIISKTTNENQNDLLVENEEILTMNTCDVPHNIENSNEMNEKQNEFIIDHEQNSDEKSENSFNDIQNEETGVCENDANESSPSFDRIQMNENSNSNDGNFGNQLNPKKLFPIFCNRNDGATVNEIEINKNSLPTLPLSGKQNKRITLKGIGNDQLQIDAGQKEYGAKECLQCGLLYTVHVPEEEKLHKEYHQSLHVLRFRGWIDENLVKEYPEWGLNGRIIYITDSSNIKRLERLKDVLSVVDKELGFSSYIFPSKFIAYLAVTRNQIVGLCLVQSLNKANKYLCVNGVDCCSTEQFDVKCGISRIWVSKPYRKMGIASKLILAVQNHTMPGIEINLNEIAFSAPTEDGKIFAKKITKRDDFFVY